MLESRKWRIETLRIPTPPVNMTTKLSLVGMHILGAVVLVPLLIKIGMTREVANE